MACDLKFNSNGKFKIMLLGDPHEAYSLNKNMRKKTKDFLIFLNMALDELEPDLVVYMGDNTSADNTGNLRDKIEEITKPVRMRKIPIAVILGNHDLESEVSDLDTHYSIYREYVNSVIPSNNSLSCRGDYNVVIKSFDGNKDVFNLWFMYSGNKAPEEYNSYYDFVRCEQIEWYEQNAEALKLKNSGKTVPAMLFQHIPVPEEYKLLTEVHPYRKYFDAVAGLHSKKGRYYVLNRSTGVQGYLGEAPCPPDINNGQFASWKKTGDIVAAFFGHDHMNDFIGTVDGITLAQCKTSGFRCYGDGLRQAVRIIELDEKYPTDFNTYMCSYRDIVGNYSQSVHGETRIMPDRVSTCFERSLKTVAGAAAVGIVIKSVSKIIKKAGIK